jgi:hypothetical protein
MGKLPSCRFRRDIRRSYSLWDVHSLYIETPRLHRPSPSDPFVDRIELVLVPDLGQQGALVFRQREHVHTPRMVR